MVAASIMGIGIFIVVMILIVTMVKFLGKKAVEGKQIAEENLEKHKQWLEKREKAIAIAQQKEEAFEYNLERMDLNFEQTLYVYHARLLNALNRARLMAKQYPAARQKILAPYAQTADWLIGQARILTKREQQEENTEAAEQKQEKEKEKDIKEGEKTDKKVEQTIEQEEVEEKKKVKKGRHR
jgi:hypothetical protein